MASGSNIRMQVDPRRRIEIDGAYNVRDIGGYETADGRTTRWRTFLRADNVSTLPQYSQDTLTSSIGVRTVIDLRRQVEIDGQPDNVLGRSPHAIYHNVDIVGDMVFDRIESPKPRDVIHGSYRNMLDRRGQKFGEALRVLARPGALPAMYHCMGGQDRTGLISALLLGLVGVPNETIAADYTLTAEYRIFAYLGPNPEIPNADPSDYTPEAYRARNCPPEVMLDTLEYLEDRHGGIEAYVRSCGVTDDDIAALRAALVK